MVHTYHIKFLPSHDKTHSQHFDQIFLPCNLLNFSFISKNYTLSFFMPTLCSMAQNFLEKKIKLHHYVPYYVSLVVHLDV